MHRLSRNRTSASVSSGGLCATDYDEDNIFPTLGLISMMYKHAAFFLNPRSYGFGVFSGDWKEMIA